MSDEELLREVARRGVAPDALDPPRLAALAAAGLVEPAPGGGVRVTPLGWERALAPGCGG